MPRTALKWFGCTHATRTSCSSVPARTPSGRGLQSVTAAIEAAHDGTASTRYGMEQCVAFEFDGCGWGVGDGWLESAGVRLPLRLTVVARFEDGDWRSMYSQLSIPVRDEAFEADGPLAL